MIVYIAVIINPSNKKTLDCQIKEILKVFTAKYKAIEYLETKQQGVDSDSLFLFSWNNEKTIFINK